MKKFLVLILLIAATIHAMEPQPKLMARSQKTYEPRTLVNYCVSAITTDLLNKCVAEVDTQFPPSDSVKLSSDMALKKLIAITNISCENESICLTPISVELKKMPSDVLDNAYRTDLITSLLPYLKAHSYAIQLCVVTIAKEFHNRDMEKHDFLLPVPIVLRQFLYTEINAYSEYRKHLDEMAYCSFPSSGRIPGFNGRCVLFAPIDRSQDPTASKVIP